MRFQFALRPLVLALSIFAFLGPLSTSLRSASGLTRLTIGGDILSFQWSPRSDSLFLTREARVLTVSSTLKQTVSDLYRVSASGGPLDLLTSNASSPSPSPDGTRIAFVSLLDDGSSHLRWLNLGTKAESDLGDADWGTQPQWANQGEGIIYGSRGRASRLDAATRRVQPSAQSLPLNFAASPRGDTVAFVAPDGLHVRKAGREQNVFATDLTVSSGAHVQTGMSWSHDGTALAFVVTREGIDPELWLVNADATHARRIMQGRMEYLAGLEWAPDDSHLIFTRTPTGSSIANASEIWRIDVAGMEAQALTRDNVEESSPQYSPDGKQLAFLSDGDLWLVQLDQVSLPLTSPPIPLSQREGQSNGIRAPLAQRQPPATIRVQHDSNNSCRKVPPGQIDTIDFETYVKRVVPVEMLTNWQSEAYKSQAVAARSYAWFWILQHSGPSYNFDVTDWTTYQYMCDADRQTAVTDAAVDATRGQYGDYAGNVIFAAYGANNGDPTLNNTWGNPYLIAVDDPVEFKATRAGNGIGMSQWGAQHWASPAYNWNYQQILMHYYTGVTIEAPAVSPPDTTPPIGGLVAPWSNWGVTANRVYLQASASDDSGQQPSVSLRARYNDGSANRTVSLTPTYDGNYWNYVWDTSTIPDQSNILVTPQITDASNNMFAGNGVTLTLDRTPPEGTVSGPQSTNSAAVTLHPSASDTGPGGLVQMAFSNNWIWEGESQAVTNGSGAVVNDPNALNGKALRGQVGVNAPGVWYGPYTDVLALGKAYRAYFRLKTGTLTASEVALLDVVDNESGSSVNLLGLKRLRGTDFRVANVYQEFYVDFYYNGTVTNGLEFRVAYRAAATLWLDRIMVVSYPVPFASSAQWTLEPGSGLKTVQAKFIDGAGNISSDAVVDIWFGITPTPTETSEFSPTPTPTGTRPTNPTGTATRAASRTPSQTPTRTVTPIPTATPELFPEFWLPFLIR